MNDDEILSVYPWVRKKAHMFCCNVDDAEDLASETIYKILVNREKYDHSKPVKSWVTAIMRNTYITMYKRLSIYDRIDDCIESHTDEITSQDLMEYKESISMIRSLSAKSTSVACMIFYAKGYTYFEISTMMKIPIGTVMSRIHVARKLLYQSLVTNR